VARERWRTGFGRITISPLSVLIYRGESLQTVSCSMHHRLNATLTEGEANESVPAASRVTRVGATPEPGEDLASGLLARNTGLALRSQFDEVLLQHPQVQAEMVKLLHVAQRDIHVSHLVLDVSEAREFLVQLGVR
jgi:hypothetical protein